MSETENGTANAGAVGVDITPQLEKRLDQILHESGFARRETEAAKKLADSTEPPVRPLLADGDASERVPPGYDTDSLSEAEYAKYGINPDTETHTWMPNPERYQHVLGYDSLAAWLREKPGRRVIKGEPKFVTNGDRVLVAFPKQELIERDRKLAEAVADAEYRLSEGDVSPATPRFRNPPDRDEAFAAHEAHKAMGMISQHGMTPEEMLARYGREGLEEIESRWRNGGMSVPVPEDQREREEYDDRKERVLARSKGKKTFAIGAGFDKSGRVVR